MIIKRIILKNFRQYKEADLNLETGEGSQKNVVLIKGEGGSGKTTFTQAFRWCLYGVTTFRDSDLINTDVIKRMHESGGNAAVSVEMFIVNHGNDYSIKRSLLYTMTSRGIKEDEKTHVVVRDLKGKVLGEHEADLLIRGLIPKALAPYFFFDGERMQNMVEELLSGKSGDISTVVRGLVGLSSLEALMFHLKNSRNTTVLKRIEKEIDVSGDAELARLGKEIENLTSELEALNHGERGLDTLTELHEKTIAEKEGIDRELATYSDVEKLQRDWKMHEEAKAKFEAEKIRKQELFVKNFQTGFSKFSLKAVLLLCNGLLDDEGLEEKGVPDICNTTLDFLIKRGKCICGKDFIEHPECLREIEKLYEYVPPMSAGTMIRELRSFIVNGIENSDSFLDNMQEYIYQIDDAIEKADNEEAQKQLIDKSILTQGDEIKSLKERQLYLIQKEENLRREIYVINRKIGEKEAKLEEVRGQKARRENANLASRKWIVYRAYAEAIYDRVVATYNEKEKELQYTFQKNINDFFRSIYKDGLKIEVNEKYKVFIEGNREMSTSQYYSIVFAFVATTLKMARDRKPDSLSVIDLPEEYPLVMDAPLSAFDKGRIKNICDVLPKIAEQVIIFIKDTDGDIAESHLCDRIARRYQINMNSYTDSTVREA